MRRILIVGAAWVGDMVMAQTLFISLKKQDPDCIIDVLAPAWSKALLQRMPEVNKALDLPFAHGDLQLIKRYQFARKLRDKYDVAIVLPNSFKSALIPLWARIPRRIGWLGEMRYGLLNDIRRLDKSKYPLMIERFIALAFAADIKLSKPYPRPKLKIYQDDLRQTLIKFNLPTDMPILVLCPGAEFGRAKKWPAEHYATFAQAYLQRGFVVWILGSKADAETGEHILKQLDESKRAYNLAGKTSLTEAIDLLSLANLVISNDSGLMHIAAAVKRPLIALYGSTSPDFTPPLTEQVAILHTDISCRPCFQRECRFGHYDCLQKLHPEDVLQAANNLIAMEKLD